MDIIIVYWAELEHNRKDDVLGFCLSGDNCNRLLNSRFLYYAYFSDEQYWIKRDCFSLQSKFEAIELDIVSFLADLSKKELLLTASPLLVILPYSFKGFWDYFTRENPKDEENSNVNIHNELHETDFTDVEICLVKFLENNELEITYLGPISKDPPDPPKAQDFNAPSEN